MIPSFGWKVNSGTVLTPGRRSLPGIATLVAREGHSGPPRGVVFAQGIRNLCHRRQQVDERRVGRYALGARAAPLRRQGTSHHDRLAQGAERRAGARAGRIAREFRSPPKLRVFTLLLTKIHGVQRALSDAKSTQKSVDQDGKDKKKAERMAAMMAGFSSVRLTQEEP